MTFSIHMANIVFHDKPEESDGEAEEIRNDPTSSPHSRGTHEDGTDPREEPGIIPAFAGNTRLSESCPFLSRDHPRIRGEHRRMQSPARTLLGSSPHSRGTHGVLEGIEKVVGIIPAFAGNTC